jgi:hypothetical protein
MIVFESETMKSVRVTGLYCKCSCGRELRMDIPVCVPEERLLKAKQRIAELKAALGLIVKRHSPIENDPVTLEIARKAMEEQEK